MSGVTKLFYSLHIVNPYFFCNLLTDQIHFSTMIELTQVIDATNTVTVDINPIHIVMIRDGRTGIDNFQSMLIINCPHLDQLPVAETREEIKALLTGNNEDDNDD